MSIKVNVGEANEINVIADPENARYIVETPNTYDVYYPFTKDYTTRLESNDRAIAAFEVKLERLSNDTAIKTFNEKVNMARNVMQEIQTERQDFHDILSFDHGKANKAVAFLYRQPPSNFSIGEILKTGKYYVAQFAGESEDKVFIRMINASKFLNAGEFKEREAHIEEKLPVGSKKYLRFMDDGKISVNEYVPKNQAQAQTEAKQETSQTNGKFVLPQEPKDYEERVSKLEKEGMTRSDAQGVVDAQLLQQGSKPMEKPQVNDNGLTKPQQAAMDALKEKFPKDWRRKLESAWTNGDYKAKGISDNHAAELQKIRNELGPDWLKSYKATPKKEATAAM